MPQITPQERTSRTQITEDSWIAPHKSIKAANTGMNLPKVEGEVQNGQQVINKEDKPQEAVALSPQMTAMARKEQQFRQKEQAFKAEKEAVDALKAKYQKYETLEAKLAAKDFSVLEELGVSYQDWTNYQINKGEAGTPENQEFKKLESKLTDLEKKREEDVNKQYEATISQYKKEASKFLTEKASDFEGLIAEAQANNSKPEEYIVQHIVESFEQDDTELSIEQAAKEIEDLILEDAFRKAKLKKVQEKIGQPLEKKTLPPPKTGLRTLTQSIAPSVESATARGQFQHLSPKERLLKAIERSQKQG